MFIPEILYLCIVVVLLPRDKYSQKIIKSEYVHVLSTITYTAMITKTITPIIRTRKTTTDVVGTSIEYRIFGVLIYRVKLITPRWYQISEGEFIYRI